MLGCMVRVVLRNLDSRLVVLIMLMFCMVLVCWVSVGVDVIRMVVIVNVRGCCMFFLVLYGLGCLWVRMVFGRVFYWL